VSFGCSSSAVARQATFGHDQGEVRELGRVS
jgi:hypothetical protein